MTTNRVFKKRDEIVSRQIAGETLLVPIQGNLADMQKIFVLNSVGEHIWSKLDGNLGLNEIRSDLMSHFEVDKLEAEADLNEFIGQLLEAGLIEER